MPSNNFQLNAKSVFLTYPKAQFPLFEYLAWARTLPNFEYATVSSESHEDGSLHRHALIQFSKPMRTRNAKIFDYKGNHCNIQGARSPAATRQYVQKDGNYLEEGEFVETKSKAGEKEVVPAEEILDKAEKMTFVQYLAWASEHRVMYAEKIWNAAAKKDISTILDDSDYRYDYLDPAFYDLMMDQDIVPGKTMIMMGASGIGKTVLAKKLIPKPALFVSHVDQLKNFRVGYHNGIVFDDISFNHTPRENQIAIVDYDNPRAIHCRHTVATIPAGITKIFTCNQAPLDILDEAIARRVQVIECGHGHLNKYRNPLSKKIN